eukprot:1325100-Prymnesium_polylepis.1
MCIRDRPSPPAALPPLTPPPPPPSPPGSKDDQMMMIIIIAGGAGGALLLAALLVVMCRIRRDDDSPNSPKSPMMREFSPNIKTNCNPSGGPGGPKIAGAPSGAPGGAFAMTKSGATAAPMRALRSHRGAARRHR